MLKITKLGVGFLLTISLLSCKEEATTPAEKETQVTPVKEQPEPQKPKQSPLELQVMLMLEGKEGNQKILRHAVETIEWDVILKTWKDGIKLYQAKYGKAPVKKHNMNAYRTLSLIQSQIELEDSTARRKQSLKDLEDTIKSAVKKEQESQ